METPSGPPVREKVHSRSRGGAAARRGGRTVYTTVPRMVQVARNPERRLASWAALICQSSWILP